MRQATAEKLVPGMILARPVFDEQMRLLLKAGAVLTPEYIDRLVKHKFRFVYINEEGTENIVAEEIVDVADRQRVFSLYAKVMSSTRTSKKTKESVTPELIAKPRVLGKLRIVKQASETILDSIFGRTSKYFLPSSNSGVDDMFSHSFDVALLSVMMGMRFHYDRRELEALAQAALLHDIGKNDLPDDLRNLMPFERNLSQEKKYREHTKIGSEMVFDDSSLPMSVSVAILQHHEHFDGSGFPSGLRGDPQPPLVSRNTRGTIFRHAEIIAVADYFDNLVNGRIEVDFVSPLVAVERMLAMEGTLFHPVVVAAAMSIINVFPVSSLVEIKQSRNSALLNHRGVVAKINDADLQHPQVLILRDDKSRRLNHPMLVDFADDPGSRLDHISDF